MVKRTRAAETKARLRDITVEQAKDGTSSFSVVKEFRKRFPEISQQDREDLIDLGLMVLAGRVAVSKHFEDGQNDLFDNQGYSEFITLKVDVGGVIKKARLLRRDVTPRKYFLNDSSASAEPKKNAKPTKEQLYHESMVEMRDKGLLDMALPDYLKLRSVE